MEDDRIKRIANLVDRLEDLVFDRRQGYDIKLNKRDHAPGKKTNISQKKKRPTSEKVRVRDLTDDNKINLEKVSRELLNLYIYHAFSAYLSSNSGNYILAVKRSENPVKTAKELFWNNANSYFKSLTGKNVRDDKEASRIAAVIFNPLMSYAKIVSKANRGSAIAMGVEDGLKEIAKEMQARITEFVESYGARIEKLEEELRKQISKYVPKRITKKDLKEYGESAHRFFFKGKYLVNEDEEGRIVVELDLSSVNDIRVKGRKGSYNFARKALEFIKKYGGILATYADELEGYVKFLKGKKTCSYEESRKLRKEKERYLKKMRLVKVLDTLAEITEKRKEASKYIPLKGELDIEVYKRKDGYDIAFRTKVGRDEKGVVYKLKLI